jgi:hypothetical protein
MTDTTFQDVYDRVQRAKYLDLEYAEMTAREANWFMSARYKNDDGLHEVPPPVRIGDEGTVLGFPIVIVDGLSPDHEAVCGHRLNISTRCTRRQGHQGLHRDAENPLRMWH